MSEWMQYTLVICGALITVLTLWNMVEQRIKSTRMPTSNLEDRVSLLEKKLEFEIKNMFMTNNRITYGKITTFCPVLHIINLPNKKRGIKMKYVQPIRDKQKIESIEEGNKVTQQAILALLNHAIDGNNEEEMIDARKGLNKYLIGK